MSLKVILSLLGVFIGGTTGFYELHRTDPVSTQFWIGLAMAGLAPIGAYLVGFYQVNPANHPSDGP